MYGLSTQTLLILSAFSFILSLGALLRWRKERHHISMHRIRLMELIGKKGTTMIVRPTSAEPFFAEFCPQEGWELLEGSTRDLRYTPPSYKTFLQLTKRAGFTILIYNVVQSTTGIVAGCCFTVTAPR